MTTKIDVFAFGIIIYEALFQTRVFPGNLDSEEILEMIKSGKSPEPSKELLIEKSSEAPSFFDVLYNQIFVACFRANQTLRPLFSEILGMFALN